MYVLICAEDVVLKYFTYAIVRCKHKEGKKNMQRIKEKIEKLRYTVFVCLCRFLVIQVMVILSAKVKGNWKSFRFLEDVSALV